MTHDPSPITHPPDFRSRNYFPELDGLRFFAFLLVFCFHGGFPGRALSEMVGTTAARALRDHGWVGVQLFFILSGFLITTLLLREEAKFGRIDLKAFWIRRILRIWPLYYVIVLVGFVGLPLIDGSIRTEAWPWLLSNHLGWFLAFLGNWSMALIGPVPYDAISVLWSVCVEEQFYILAPLLVVAVPQKVRIPLVVLLMIGAVAGRAYSAVLVDRGGMFGPLFFQWSTITQLDTLLSGVLLAMVFDRHPPGERASKWAGWWQYLLAAGAIWFLIQPGLAKGPVWRRTFDFVALWIIGTGIVALPVVRDGWFRRFLALPRLVWLGRISYGLYMYHEVAFVVRVWAPFPWMPYHEVILGIEALAITIGLAWASYRWIEEPFLRLKTRFTRVPSRPV